MRFLKYFTFGAGIVPAISASLFLCGATQANAQQRLPSEDDVAYGSRFFHQNCALCHATTLGPDNRPVIGQGPNLLGVVGRQAGTGANFNYTAALKQSHITWSADTLDHFLSNPSAAVPGTTMPIPLPSPAIRHAIIAYLSTLAAPANMVQTPATEAEPASDPGDWHHAAPGMKHFIDLATLPAPFATRSAGNGPSVVSKPADATLAVPPGFKIKLFADDLSGPRLVRLAPNGDIFITETRENHIRVMRAADGAETPTVNQIFAEDLNRPFGVAFYPPGDNPQWIYVANNNSVVRIPYHNGDLTATGAPQVIVPKLTDSHGGHSTRDVAFSKDGKRLFITIGSASNVAEGMSRKTTEAIRAWEAEHGHGSSWDAEINRADILYTDPEGHDPMRPFATGVRNGVSIVVNQETGDLWTATNERDGLGDDLVPDYVTRIMEGAYYGWPWYYMGNHEDPRHAGERPDLAGQATVPDVPLQSHSAPLEMTFYTATSGVSAFPEEYRGDAFVACHGSWNRSSRTGYKVIRVRLNHGIPTGEYDDFLTGFVVDNHSVWGRPVGVAVAHDGALLVTDDGNSTMWRISYAGK